MRTQPVFVTLTLFLAFAQAAGAAEPADSVVKVTATVSYPNPLQPWTPGKTVEKSGSGVVIEGKRILTNAHVVLYATEIHVEAGPGGGKCEAKITGLGTDIDLAVLTLKEEKLFQKRPALPRLPQLPRVQDTVAVHGYPSGGRERSVTRGVVSRLEYGILPGVGRGMLIQVRAQLEHGNSGGPALVGDKMIGVVCSRLDEVEGISYVIPNREIDGFLKRLKGGRYEPKATETAGTDFQRLEDPIVRGMLNLEARTRGVLVRPREGTGKVSPLREFDVLTRIGRYEIDNEGMVQVEDDRPVPFLTLVPQLARGRSVTVTVLRDGKEIPAELPVTTEDNRLIRDYKGETPSWFIHGPLVFSPVMEPAVPLYFRMNPGLYAARAR
jgi:S1-C subfamily serine protease